MSARAPVVVPSLLAADLSRLGAQLDAVKAAGCRWVSVDVMDGRFVPNLSFGPDFVRLVKSRGLEVDAHLMVADPLRCAPWFARAGADFVTVHWEAVPDPRAALAALRALGVKAGLALKPATPAEGLCALLEECDLALVMTVEPGFGGQSFMPGMLPKVEALRRAAARLGSPCWVQVDGGVGPDNIARAAAAGADSLVAGSAVFGAPDPGAAFRALQEAAASPAAAGS